MDECEPLPGIPHNIPQKMRQSSTVMQGLTLVHFSSQLEPCLTHKSTLYTLKIPKHPHNTGYTTPTRTLYPIKSAQVELRGKQVSAPAVMGWRSSESPINLGSSR